VRGLGSKLQHHSSANIVRAESLFESAPMSKMIPKLEVYGWQNPSSQAGSFGLVQGSGRDAVQKTCEVLLFSKMSPSRAESARSSSVVLQPFSTEPS